MGRNCNFDPPLDALGSELSIERRINIVRQTREYVRNFLWKSHQTIDLRVSSVQVERFSQISAMRRKINFFCYWCWEQIHNNVWGTYLGDWFPKRIFFNSTSGKSLFELKMEHFCRFWACGRSKWSKLSTYEEHFFLDANHQYHFHGKPIVTFGEPPEVITQLKGFFPILHLEDRYCSQSLRR